MLLFKKKIRKYQGGGSVGYASAYKVNIGAPNVSQPSAQQNMISKYRQQKPTKAPKAKKPPKKRELDYKLDNMTEGAQNMFGQYMQKNISDFYNVDPSNPQYGQMFQLLQLDSSDLQTKLNKDFKQYKKNLGIATKNKSLSDIAVMGGSAFVRVQGPTGMDIKAVPYEALFKGKGGLKISDALTVQNLADVKNNATANHFKSAFAGSAINGRYDISSVIGNLGGADSLYKYIGQQAKAGGQISAKDGTLQVGSLSIQPELLEAFWKDGKMPANVQSTNAAALDAAFDQVKQAIDANAGLKDSMTSLILSRIPEASGIDTSTTSGRRALQSKMASEENKIIIEQLAKQFKMKLAGVTGDDSGSGGAADIKGSTDISDNVAAFDPTLGDPEPLQIGDLHVNKEKAQADIDGQILNVVNSQLGDDITTEFAKAKKSNEDVGAVKIADSPTMQKVSANHQLYLPDGQPLGREAFGGLYLRHTEQIKLAPKMMTKNGAPAVNEMKRINEWIKSPKVQSEFEADKQKLLSSGKASSENLTALLEKYKMRGFHELGYDSGAYKMEPMYLIPIEFTDESKLERGTLDTLTASPYITEFDDDDTSLLENTDADSGGWDNFYKGYVMVKATPPHMQRAQDGRLFVSKIHAGIGASRRENRVFNHKVTSSDIFDVSVMNQLLNRK